MNETIFLTVMFAILAFSGAAPAPAHPMKICSVGGIVQLFDDC